MCKCIWWLLLDNECIIYSDSPSYLLLDNASVSLTQGSQMVGNEENRLCLRQTLCSANKEQFCHGQLLLEPRVRIPPILPTAGSVGCRMHK